MEHLGLSELPGPALANTRQDGGFDAKGIIRQAIHNSTQGSGDDNSAWSTMSGLAWSLNMRFCGTLEPANEFIIDLHDLWLVCYKASKEITAGSVAQDRLAFEVLRIQGQDAIFRLNANSHAVEIATTSNGVIWSDMPYFAPDMVAFWIKDCAAMSSAQRINTSTFLSKLACVGVARERLCSIALNLFREALETPRSLGDVDSACGEDATRSMEDLSLGDLLPLLKPWLNTSGIKIIQVSDNLWNDYPDAVGVPGSLYCAEGLPSGESIGFSPKRWFYWLRRLDEIIVEADGAGNMKLAELAQSLMDSMLIGIQQTHSKAKDEFKANRGVLKHQPVVFENF